MRTCPICGSTYDAAVDFCFKDGAPLSDPDDPAEPTASSSFSDLSIDDLEPPDAISLSNIPAVEEDEDHVTTQQLPTDLVDAEEFERSTQDQLAPVDPPDEAGVAPGLDSARSMIDPFGGHEHERFRAKQRGDDSPADVTDLPEPGAAPVPGDEAAEDDAAPPPAEKPAEKKAAAKKPADKKPAAKKPADKKAAAAVKPPPPRRPPPAREDEGGNKGLLIFVGIAALLLVGLIGWQLRPAPSAPEPSPTPVASRATPTPRPTPRPTPEPTPEVAEEPTPEEGAEGAEGDPEVAEQPTDEPDAAAVDPAAEQRRRQAEQARRERDRRERERRERERAEAAAADTPPPMPFSADPTPTPTPRATPRPTPTPEPATGSDNPWGGAAAVTEGTMEVTTKPAGATVTVDGRNRGVSPARVTLKPGQYEVRVVLADHFPQTRVITVSAGATAKAGFTLESSKPAPVAEATTGSLNVITASPAALWIDGVSKGRTPTTVTLPEGPHAFRLQIDGQPPHEETFNVRFNSDGKATKFFNMVK